MRLGHGTATVLVSVILLGAAKVPQSDSVSRGMSANELARKVVSNELKSQDEDHVHWMYRLEIKRIRQKAGPGNRADKIRLSQPAPLR